MAAWWYYLALTTVIASIAFPPHSSRLSSSSSSNDSGGRSIILLGHAGTLSLSNVIPASDNEFDEVLGICRTGVANQLMVSDKNSHELMMLSDADSEPSTATLGVIAGTGGTGGDDGDGVAAEIEKPTDIIYLPIADVYYIASEMDTIRKMLGSTPYSVTTVSGVYNDDSVLDNVYGLAIDVAETTLWFSEKGGNRIGKLSLGLGSLKTIVAGSTSGTAGDVVDVTGTSARFDQPRGICWGDTAQSKIIIADSHNNKVKVVAVGSSLVEAFACSGADATGNDGPKASADCRKPTGLAFRTTTMTDYYWTEKDNNVLRHLSTNSDTVTTIFGTDGSHLGPPAGFEKPYGLVFNTEETILYIADKTRVSKVTGFIPPTVATSTSSLTESSSEDIIGSSATIPQASVSFQREGTDSHYAGTSTLDPKETLTPPHGTTLSDPVDGTISKQRTSSNAVDQTSSKLHTLSDPPAGETSTKQQTLSSPYLSKTGETLLPPRTATDAIDLSPSVTVTISEKKALTASSVVITPSQHDPSLSSQPERSSTHPAKLTLSISSSAPLATSSQRSTVSVALTQTEKDPPLSTTSILVAAPPTFAPPDGTIEPTNPPSTPRRPPIEVKVGFNRTIEELQKNVTSLIDALATSGKVHNDKVKVTGMEEDGDGKGKNWTLVTFEVETDQSESDLQRNLQEESRKGGRLGFWGALAETITLRRKSGRVLYALGWAFFAILALIALGVIGSMIWAIIRRVFPDYSSLHRIPVVKVEHGRIGIGMSSGGANSRMRYTSVYDENEVADAEGADDNGDDDELMTEVSPLTEVGPSSTQIDIEEIYVTRNDRKPEEEEEDWPLELKDELASNGRSVSPSTRRMERLVDVVDPSSTSLSAREIFGGNDGSEEEVGEEEDELLPMMTRRVEEESRNEQVVENNRAWLERQQQDQIERDERVRQRVAAQRVLNRLQPSREVIDGDINASYAIGHNGH